MACSWSLTGYDKGKKCYCTVKFTVMSWKCGMEKEECALSSPVNSSTGSFPPGTGQLGQHRSEKACLWGCWLQAATSCHFFLKLIKGVIWTSLQFPAVCGKDQSTSIKWAEIVVNSSWSLARAARRGSGCTDRFLLSFPLGMCCWLVHRDTCFSLLSDKPLGSDSVWVHSWRGSSVPLGLKLKWVKQ